jgi:hypothetical protein
LQNRELLGEHRELPAARTAKSQAPLLFAACSGLRPARLPLGGNLGDEVAHLPNGLLGFFLRRRLDHVADFRAGGVHGFELIGRHSGNSREWKN